MKRERKAMKKKALFTALLFGAGATLFGVGFSAFVFSDPSHGELGNIHVGVGEAALVEVDPGSIAPFTCSQQGFLQSDNRYGLQASLSLDFRYFVDSEDAFAFDFSFRQIDRASVHPDFDFTKFIDKMTLTNRRSPGGQINATLDLSPFPLAGEKGVKATCFTDEIRALGRGITFYMTLDIHLDVSAVCAAGSASDFAKHVYYPLHENKCSFDVGIDVHA